MLEERPRRTCCGRSRTQRLRDTTILVQDGIGMEICNANCACASAWCVHVVHVVADQKPSYRLLHKRAKIPRVTHGEDLCNYSHESLMGTIYAEHATSYSMRRFYAKPICIINRESACILDISWGGFMQKRAIRGKPCNQLRFA